jgi:hypothetical protein
LTVLAVDAFRARRDPGAALLATGCAAVALGHPTAASIGGDQEPHAIDPRG